MPPEPITVELAERMVRIEASIERLRADLTRYFSEYADHETRIRALEREVMTRYEERMRHVEKEIATQDERIKPLADQIKSLTIQARAWDIVNSLGVVVGTIFGLNKP